MTGSMFLFHLLVCLCGHIVPIIWGGRGQRITAADWVDPRHNQQLTKAAGNKVITQKVRMFLISGHELDGK